MTIQATIAAIRTGNDYDAREALKKFAIAILDANRRQKASLPLPTPGIGDRRLRDRARTKGMQILELLAAHPCDIQMLARITPKYGSRIHDLRRAGHHITTRQAGFDFWYSLDE